MNKSICKGFTLIELLVVISIIALLSSVILASLNSARLKALDSKTLQQVLSVRNALTIYYSTNNNYGPANDGSDPAGTTIGTGCASGVFADPLISPYVQTVLYPPATGGFGKCSSGGPSGFAISVRISSVSSLGSNYICIDSRGKIITYAARHERGTLSIPGDDCGSTE